MPFSAANRVDDTKPVILTCDGHESHETPEIQKAIYSWEGCDFIVLCFPSKCTHKMQPLDVVVFAQSGRAWREHCEECLHRGIIINRYNVIQNYLQVREKYMTEHLIKTGSKKTGIYPINPNVFTKEDFAPSKASSTIAWAPSSYPADVPSSGTAIPSDAETENDGGDTLVVQNFRDIEFDEESELDDPDYEDAELRPSNPSPDLASESEGELETEHSTERRQNTSTEGHTYHTRSSSPGDI
jgi:hypothetical protein